MKRELVLAALRCARLRAQLLTLEIDELGIAIKYNMIAPEIATKWLYEMGAMDLVGDPSILPGAAAPQAIESGKAGPA